MDAVTVAQYGDTKRLQRSLAITTYFKDLSLQMSQTIPDKLVHYLVLSDAAARVQGIQTMMTEVLHMTDKTSMVTFLHKYIPKIPNADEQCDEMITFLGDTNALLADLDRATHLDINDMVNAIKKGVLTQLFDLVQRSQSDVLDADDVSRHIKKQLTSYEWISRLTDIQEKLHQLLKIRQKRPLTPPEEADLNQLIGIDLSLEAQPSTDDVLALMRHYGVIDMEPVGKRNHRVLSIKAANLSLKDILSPPKLVRLFEQSDEIRFLCTGCFYMDACLDASRNPTWVAKNIAIKAAKIHVMIDDCLIDLSGSNGVDAAVVPASDGQTSGHCGPGDHGSHGEHGTSGTSGGNIFMCMDEVIQSERLTLLSCGGNGGNGQDGGDGQNGKAKPSESDYLSSWPDNFARLNGRTSGAAEQKILARLSKYGQHYHESESIGDNYVYAENPDGVQFLFGTVDDVCHRYGFLLSMSKDGESANGGNAGTGGRGGGGGQAGVIDIETLDGRPHVSHALTVGGYKGQDGKPGKTGKCGKREIAERKTDNLQVDGAGPWGTTKSYHVFIDVKSWNRSSKKGELGSGKYYCRQTVSKKLEPAVDSDHLGFFQTYKNSHCPTKHNHQAEHGKANDQHHITETTKTKSIDKAVIHIDYQLLANQTLVLRDRDALLQSLEQLEHTLHEKIQELETIHQKQQHKQLCRVNQASGTNLMNGVDIKPVSRGIMAEPVITFESGKLTSVVVGNPWISQDDLRFFQSNEVALRDKYFQIRKIIQDQLDALRQQVENENETSRFEQLKQKWKAIKFSPTESGYVHSMLDAIFVPIVLVMHFEHTPDIHDVIQFLTTVRKTCSSKFHRRLDRIKATIDPILLKKYRWCILAEIHIKHIATILYADPVCQSKSVTVYRKVYEQKSIEQLDKFASSLHEIDPYRGSLPIYRSSCDAVMPLSQSTQTALEFLMDFINETNTGSAVYVPDILSAIQEEYASFCCTINDLDLLFIMTYLQDKLLHLMDKTHLEDLFCDGVLSKVNDHTIKGESYIMYQGLTYRIDTVGKQTDLQVSITLKCKASDKTWNEWLKEKHLWLKAETHHLIVQPDKVTLDGALIAFPNDELLVSPIDTNEVWHQLQQNVMREGRIPDDAVLEKKLDTGALSLPHDVHDEYKVQFLTLLRQAREAQDIPYDVFSFYRPSQWVEQLILYVVQKHYLDNATNFVADVQRAISGLSHCVDKTLYFTFFRQFLLDFTFKNEHHCTEISETLQVMKSVFIDRQLCTLVTEQGIAQAWPQSSAETILADLEDVGVIDGTGTFLSYVTPDTLQSYCSTRNLSSPPYLNTVYTMQQYTHDLSDKELSFWSHKIHELRLYLDLQDLVHGDIICDEMLMYAQLLVRHYGNDTVSKFVCALNSKKVGVTAALLQELIEKCARKEWIFEVVVDQLKQSHPLPEVLDCLRTYDWELERDQERTTVKIIHSIKSKLTEDTCRCLSDKLDAITTEVNRIKAIENQKKHSQIAGFQSNGQTTSDDVQSFLVTPICEYTKEDIKQWVAEFRESTVRNKQASIDHPLFAEAFAVIRRGVTLFYDTEKSMKGIIPRDTQMVASLLFFQNLSVQGGAWQGTRLMQQISTGEGKTMIITMTAIFKALLGEKVDIVTSSSVLATRDAAEQEGLYSLFDVSVSHCCHEELTRRQQAYESDVIYGDIGSFQRDILETNFYGRMIRAAHNYDNVIIDEVDSMLVDKGETMLYLPHALPDLNALEHVYLEIWTLVNARDFIGFPNEQDQLHDYLKCKLFGGLPTNAFTAISDITIEQSEDIHCRCIDVGLIDRDYHCLTTNNNTAIQRLIGTIDAMLQSVDVTPSQLQQEMMLVIQQHIETTPLIHMIPKPLHPFIKKSLKSWIQSAVNAKYYRPNKEYIIDIDRRESAGDRYPKIIIMDNETGVEQESSEWGSGLHQFLQLKHHLRLSTESLKAVYMSNISFFTPRYTSVMGVTGTLGSNAEHTLFNKLYENIQLMVLPTYKPSRLRIDAPKCCSTTDIWETAIGTDVQEKLNQHRAVLLICEDVERAIYLHQYFKQNHTCLVPELYTSSHQEKLEETGDSEPGRFIIATNLAGRGTDLNLTDSVKHNGGLHVCLSYLPPNVRVEQQAYGRAARRGDPGSCKLIFHDEQGDLSYAIRKRDLREAQRVSDIEADYYHNIKFQEELFQKFTDIYETIEAKHKDELKGRPELDYCLDCWAYFLDRHSDAIESIPSILTDVARGLEKQRLRRAFDKEVKMEIAAMSLSPARLMQLGHTYMKQAVKRGDKYKDAGNKRDYEKAIAKYKQAMEQNPGDPFAKYYEASAQFNQVFRNKNTTLFSGKLDRRKLKQTFYRLIPLFQDKIKQCRSQMSALQLANRFQDQSLTAGAQYFDEQKQHEMEVYHQYIASMQDIIGNEITPKTFDHADWGEKEAVNVFEIVKEIFPLKDCRVSQHYCERLTSLLKTEPSYHTYEEKIEKRIVALKQRRPTPVTKHDFKGGFPDKHHFWDQLKIHHLITHDTHEPVSKEDGGSPKEDEGIPKEERFGYWNPTIDWKGVKFGTWDCIDADSFDWIHGLSDQERKDLVSHLTTNNVLNRKGQLIELDISKPLHLPEAYTPYYKQIKDTLWIQSIYRYVLDHLRDCVIIDMSEDIDNNISTDTSMSDQLLAHEAMSQTRSSSVVDILISMNPMPNASSAADIRHIQVSSRGETAPSLRHTSSDMVYFTMVDHIPDEEFNQAFTQQLHHHNLRVTNVSGDGLNCMIHAMIQHAKCEYHTHCFKEDANTIRKHLQHQHPDVSGMLHSDDRSAETILKLVNDHCSATIKMVSVVIASSDGPIIYGGTCDKRFSTGRHVVIWQQGNHYVSIVHHHDMVQATSPHQVIDPDIQKASLAVPKLTQHQLSTLERLGIVKENEGGGNYEIRAGLDMIERTLQLEESSVLSEQDKKQVGEFLRLKLEIDFKTLNRSPRQLLTDQHLMLYDDLCQYAVIKPVKMKEDAKDIEQVTKHMFGYKSCMGDRKPWFDITILNGCFKQKGIEELNKTQQKELVWHLESYKIITRTLFSHRYCVLIKDSVLTPDLLCSATFLTEAQRGGVKDYLRLMIQLQVNVDTIISTLKNQQGTIRELETPEITLRKLTDVFDGSLQDKGDVLGWFSDNQCELIIDLAEQKWSWKTITTAIGAIALGVAQIALGAVLLVTSVGTGSFICNALISEGVSDMIFGIEGLVRGHCNWSQYWDNKKMSLAITVATAGLGALFAKGKTASKYAYKAFGNANRQLVKATAKETGKSVSKVMTREVTKKIGKKVAGAVVDAGINLATEAIVGQLSQALDSMSDSIIDSFDTMCHDEELQDKMSTFLRQQDPQNAEKYLHQITTRVLQRHTFLDLWDKIESGAQKGTSVLTQAHGQASSHLRMRGEKLKGQKFMKGIGYVSRFAPLVTETMKSGMVKIKMEKVKTALKHDLEQRPATEHGQLPLDEARIKEIKDKEIAAMKQYLSQEVSQRGRTIATTGLQIVSQELRKRTKESIKEYVFDPLKGHIDIRRLKNYERKLEASKSDNNRSQIKKYERKLQKLMTRTCSPKVFARMIEHHNALLGPAFAVPALEKLIDLPIRIVTEDGKAVLNVQQQLVGGNPIEITFIPGKGDRPGHYIFGKERFSPRQHGNDCLIHAVLEGAGRKDMDAGQVRIHIAEACLDLNHPCHDYIKRGIARNYVRIGVVGGVKYTGDGFTEKAPWYPHMDKFLLNDWKSNPDNATNSGIDISKWTRAGGSATLDKLGLNRCHRIAEKPIQNSVERAITDPTKVVDLKLLRKELLPTISEVEAGQSHFKGDAKKAFLDTYKGTDYGKSYTRQVNETIQIINRWGNNKPGDYLKLVKHLSNSPLNVSLGHASTNQSIASSMAMDFNPGEHRSEGLWKTFKNKEGFPSPEKTAKGNYKTSFFTHPADEHY